MTKPKNPFSALEELRDSLPPGTERGPADAGNAAANLTVRKPGPARAVVRMERKGRGGKEATVIEKLDLPASHLEKWCRELKQALGCGGTVEGDTIVLQGDLRARITPVLTSKGVVKVTLG
jgi:translation initiation factor 1